MAMGPHGQFAGEAFAALDKLTSPMKKIGLGQSRRGEVAIAATTRACCVARRAPRRQEDRQLKSLGKGIEDSYGKIDAMRRKIRGLREEMREHRRTPTRKAHDECVCLAQRQEARLVATQERAEDQASAASGRAEGDRRGRWAPGRCGAELASRMEVANAAPGQAQGD